MTLFKLMITAIGLWVAFGVALVVAMALLPYDQIGQGIGHFMGSISEGYHESSDEQ